MLEEPCGGTPRLNAAGFQSPIISTFLAIPVVSQKQSGPLWGASRGELPKSSAEPSNLEHPEMTIGSGEASEFEIVQQIQREGGFMSAGHGRRVCCYLSCAAALPHE